MQAPIAADRFIGRVRAWLTPERLALIAILLIALWVRLYAISVLPYVINPDESENAMDAIGITVGHAPNYGLFGFDWKPQPAFSVYLLSFFFELFGTTPFALRFPGVLLSTLALIPFYAILRRHSSIVAALATTFLLSMHIAFMHFSRSAWENIFICLYAAGAIAALLRAVDLVSIDTKPTWRAWAWFLAAGAFNALSIYGYFSGRLVPVIFICSVLVLIWYKRQYWRRIVSGAALALAFMLLLFAPMYPAIAQNWDFFNLRAHTVGIFYSPEYQKDPVLTIRQQTGHNLAVLWNGYENNQPRYFPVNEPLLDLPLRILVLGGMLLTWRGMGRGRPERWIWWFWLLIGWITTQILTTDTPDGARGIMFLPALIAFSAFSIDWAIARVYTWRPQWLPVLIVLGSYTIASIGVGYYDHYLEWQTSSGVSEMLMPYVRMDEFDSWSKEVKIRAIQNQPRLTNQIWRDQKPNSVLINTGLPTSDQQPNQPVGSQPVPPTPLPTVAPVAAGNWPALFLTIDSGVVKIVKPRSVAFGSNGTFYALDADPAVQAIFKFGPDGKLLQQWGGPGDANSDGHFVEVSAIAVDQNGSVLALDAETGWIQVFDADGKFIRRWGGPDLHLYKPRALTIGANGNFYIADTGGQRAVSYTPDGQVIQIFGRNGDNNPAATALKEPSGVASLPDGSVVVVDATAGLVRHYAADGQLINTFPFITAAAIDGPRVAVASNGALYLTAPDACQVIRMDVNGKPQAAYGDCNTPDQLKRPGAVAIAADGQVLISDLETGKLLLFKAP